VSATAGWIGVDLDGTLAHYTGWKGVDHIGEPIPPMLERVKRWVEAGIDVRIFTARVTEGHPTTAQARAAVQAWVERHVGRHLPITNVKDFDMLELWDDRAVQVLENTGHAPVGSTRWLV
jgi:hypothetical protein